MTEINDTQGVKQEEAPKSNKKGNMLVRIITAIVSIAIFVPVCIFSNTIVFNIFISLLSVVGCFVAFACDCTAIEQHRVRVQRQRHFQDTA